MTTSKSLEERAAPSAAKVRNLDSNWFPSVERNTVLLAEMGWLTLALTIQLRGMLRGGGWISCGMLACYILFRSAKISRIAPYVWWLGLSMALGTFGGFGTEMAQNIWEPIQLALAVVAIAGVFAVEYHTLREIRLVAIVAVMLLPIAIKMSMVRNELLDLWNSGSRVGINLIGCFLAMIFSYSLLLKWPANLMAPLSFVGLIASGSRTSILAALVISILHRPTRRTLREHWVKMTLVAAFCLFILIASDPNRARVLLSGDFVRVFSEASLENRYSWESFVSTVLFRFQIGDYWLIYVFTDPSWFGHGEVTYGASSADSLTLDFPHNGILHVFNGFGIPAGIIYVLVLFMALKAYWRKRETEVEWMEWAFAFYLATISRMFTEVQLLASGTHIYGFALCYGVGLFFVAAHRDVALPRARRAGTRRGRGRRGRGSDAEAGTANEELVA